MSEKRFFEIDYDEIYYIVDSSKLKRKKDDFEDEEDFEQYCLENSLIGTQVVDLLNKIQSLENTILSLENEVTRQKNQIKLLNGQFSKIPPKIREVWLND